MKVYNTLTRRKEELKTIEEGKLMADIGGVPVELGVLAKQAEHDPDPTVLPKPEQMADALHTGAAKALQRLNI